MSFTVSLLASISEIQICISSIFYVFTFFTLSSFCPSVHQVALVHFGNHLNMFKSMPVFNFPKIGTVKRIFFDPLPSLIHFQVNTASGNILNSSFVCSGLKVSLDRTVVLIYIEMRKSSSRIVLYPIHQTVISTCAELNELPSNISTMDRTQLFSPICHK